MYKRSHSPMLSLSSSSSSSHSDLTDLERILLGEPHYASIPAPPLFVPYPIPPPILTPAPTDVLPIFVPSTPSPPSLIVADTPEGSARTTTTTITTDEALAKQKKRRRKEDTGEEIYNEGFTWTDPSSVGEFASRFPVVDRTNMQLSNDIYNLVIKRFEASSQYSPGDNAWICYRQNQFKITCYYPKPPELQNLAVVDNNELVPVTQMFAKLCAIKENIGRTPLNQVAYVGIQHVGKKRTKKDKSDLSPVPFINGRAEFTNMQFEKSNFIRGQQLECFHLVLFVIAQASNQKCYQVLSKISPRLIVRAQNPGFYEENNSPQHNEQAVATTHDSQELAKYSPPTEPVIKREETSVFNGRVGINTNFPSEALTVDGNVLVTGNYLKPSDMRIKSEVDSVNTTFQLENIRKLKLYDYTVSSRRERGLFAQELLDIMPSAVHRVGNVMYDGALIPDFLVVNERALLYENIGATKQLDFNIEKEKEKVEKMGYTMLELQEHDKQTDIKISALHKAVNFLVDEEPRYRSRRRRERYILEDTSGSDETYEMGISLFNLGPARTIFLLGFFFPWAWIAGIPYVFSNLNTRRVAGFLNAIMFGVWMVLRSMRDEQLHPRQRVIAQFVFFCFGVLCCFCIKKLRDWKGNDQYAHPPEQALVEEEEP